MAVGSANETRRLDNRSDDDNRLRHTYILAMHDLCWGGDEQWLIDLDHDNMFFSHDHGWFLPPTGHTWSETDLLREIDNEHRKRDTGADIVLQDVKTVADALRSLSRPDIVSALATVPISWPVTDAELETVGYFFERRASPVADRISAHFGVV